MFIKEIEKTIILLLLLTSLHCIFGQTESFTPIGAVGEGPAPPTPVGEVGGKASANKTQGNIFGMWQDVLKQLRSQIQTVSPPFTPSAIDLWLAQSGIGASTSGQTGISAACKLQWYVGCEPWHAKLPSCWHSYVRPYNPAFNYQDWRAHVDQVRIPQLTAILNNSRMSGARASDSCFAIPF